MKISLIADLHTDGVTFAMELHELYNAETNESLLDLNGIGARVIEAFRARGIEVHDLRHVPAEACDGPHGEVEPVEIEPAKEGELSL
jgi:hypothetical protein